MIFSLDVRRARKGDCLLLHFGTSEDPGLVMIDGGPKAVYEPHLKPRLIEIRNQRGLDDQRPLPIDLLMVSHVDDDHIQGVLDLTRELRETVGTPFVQIRRLWHNSFDTIIGKNPKELTAGVAAQFGAAALGGELPADATIEGADEEVAASTLKVLASIPQGLQLRLDAQKLGVPLNPQTNGSLMMASKMEIKLAKGLSFIVAGPMQADLLALQQQHDDWLKELKKSGQRPEDTLSAFVDNSVPSLSSIVVLAKAGGKTILLTGDARGNKILEGLEQAGAMRPNGTLHVDVLKAPDHGSSNNVAPVFFQRITADHYVFSGDGEHGNPERETLEMLLDARGTEPYHIHLTYPIDEIDVERRKDWERERAKERARMAKGTSKREPREAWSPAKQGLVALFKNRPLAKGQLLHVVPDVDAHVIDLLDPLGSSGNRPARRVAPRSARGVKQTPETPRPPEAADLPVSERAHAAFQMLVEGTEDERDDLVNRRLHEFSAADLTEFRKLVIDGLLRASDHQDYRLRDPKTSQTIRGWFVGALGSIELFNDSSAATLADLAVGDSSEWVRYWSLAHLYWGRADPIWQRTVELLLRKPPMRGDLVQTLATAVAAKQFSPERSEDLRARLRSHDERELWAVLRALQIVGFPAFARDIATLLLENPSDAVTYDALLVLTSPEMGESGYIALRELSKAEQIMSCLLRASHEATENKVRRFASILRWFNPNDLATIWTTAQSTGPLAPTARRLLAAGDVQPLPSSVLEPGGWRAEFAYRAVLEQPARYELLDTLDVAGLIEAVRALSGDAPAQPSEILAPLRAKDSSLPNRLWTAWIETVHAQKLQQH